jgi:hypothetical protein
MDEALPILEPNGVIVTPAKLSAVKIPRAGHQATLHGG